MTEQLAGRQKEQLNRQQNKQQPGREQVMYLLSLLLLAGLVWYLHRFTQPLQGDDSWFSTKLDVYTMPGYLVWRYENWTSRLLPETFLAILTHGHFLLWCLLDTALLLLLITSLRELLGLPRTAQSIGMLTLMTAFVPVNILYSAGWIATSTNYFWPLACGCYALLPLRRLADHRPVRRPEYGSFTAALLFAANQEQMAAILLLLYLGAICGLCLQEHRSTAPAKRSHLPVYPLVLTALLVLSLVFIMTCPGNGLRETTEIRKWFPQFPQYGFGQKLLMGYLTTMVYYVAGVGHQLLFPVFSLILAVAVWSQCSVWWKRTAAVLPVIGTAFLGFAVRDAVKNGLIWHPSYYYDLFGNVYLPQHDLCNYVNWQLALETFCDLALLLWLIAELFWVFGKTVTYAGVLLTLAAGFASRFVIGFSPTVYASGYRTTLFATMTLQAVSVLLLCRIRSTAVRRVLLIVLLVLLAVSVSFQTDGKTF